MDILNNLAPEIWELTHERFGQKIALEATKLIHDGKINVSFTKGSNPDSYFVISGIILVNPQVESRLSVKNKNQFHGHCSCIHWTPENQCVHIAALFLKFHYNHYLEKTMPNSDDPTKLTLRGGVHVEEYGTIVTSPGNFLSSPFNATYAGLQYVLRDRKVISFPLVNDWRGKIKIHLHDPKNRPEYHRTPHWEDMVELHFTLIHPNGKELKEVSLFEYLYFFDWNTGEAWHIPDNFRDLIKKLKQHQYLVSPNELLRMTTLIRQKGDVTLWWKDVQFDQEKAQEIKHRFTINGTSRPNFLNLKWEIYDDEERLIDPPEILKTFVNQGGLLESFRTKTDAVRFMLSLEEILFQDHSIYRNIIHTSSKKDTLHEWMQHILHTEETFFVQHEHFERPYKIKHDLLLSMEINLVHAIGESVAKNSSFDINEHALMYQVPKGQLFTGLSTLYQKLTPLGVDIFYEDKKIKKWSSHVRFERQNADVDWFDLSLHINKDDFDIIKKADLDNNIVITDNGLVLITDEQKELMRLMKKYATHEKQEMSLDETGNTVKIKLNFQRARIFELFELQKAGITGALTPEEEKLCHDLLSLNEMPHYPVPPEYLNLARAYQLQGYQWLRFLYENRLGACLADDMGLGKTLQTIIFLQSIIDKVERILIVCPVSILINWQNEIKKFSTFSAEIYHGDQRILNSGSKIFITSYGIMKKEDEDELLAQRFDVVIFDEVQHLKNIRSLGASAARNIKAKFRLCLTGTPVENDLSEFYNILDLALPGIWGEISFIRSQSASKNRLLAKRMARPFILRRTKEQVLQDLPDKEEHYVYLNFSDEEQTRYKDTLNNIQTRFTNTLLKKKYGEILKSLLEMRQLCLWQHHEQTISTKVDYLLESLSQILEEGHKAIVFSQFTTYLDIIQGHFNQRHWNYSRIDGSQTMKTRQKQVENFQHGNASVFLISLKAGGVGLNLTAASYIYLMDPWWNPAVENQAIDRAHRIGQTNKVTVYRPVIKSSIEEKVIKLQNAKRELFNELMSSEDDQFYNGRLNMNDFKELLSMD